MNQVLKQRPHEETDYYESEVMEPERSLFQKITGLFGDILTILTCFRLSIAAIIVITRG